MKRVLRHPRMIGLLSMLAAFYIRLVLRTSQLEMHIPEEAKPFWRGDHPCIIAFWHGRLLLMPHLRPKSRPMDVLSSQHRDGVLISDTVQRLGIGTVSGSSSKGGAAAFRGLLRSLKSGSNVSITPDGPRGPGRVAARGVAQIAEMTKVPVLAAAYSSTRGRRLRSWDRFFVPHPFARIAFVTSAPIYAQPGQDAEALRQTIEAALNHVTDEADRRVGIPLEESLPPR